MRIIDQRTEDGSRRFLCLPKTTDWEGLRGHLAQLPGLRVANYLAGGFAPMLDFFYWGHRFSIQEQSGEFWFTVLDPMCSDLTLYQIAIHVEGLLCGGAWHAPAPHRSSLGSPLAAEGDAG